MRRIRCGAESTHIIDQVDLVTLIRWGGGMLYAVDVCGGWRACTSLLVATVLYSTRCLLCDVFARYGIRVAPVLSVERVFSQNLSIESIVLYSKTSIACGLRKAGVRGGAELRWALS
jgi:hypothetical protein